MKSILFRTIKLVFILGIFNQLHSETVPITDFLNAFDKNSSGIKKVEYYEKIKKLEKDNISVEYLPKLNITGQISYQSETIKLPISSPLFPIKEIPKDQYYLGFEIDQLVFDGFAISGIKKISDERYLQNESNIKIENKKQIELIVRLYFNILILQKQKEILLSIAQDLNSKRNQFESLLKNGVILKSDFNQIEIELIKRNQDLLRIENDLKKLQFAINEISQTNFVDFVATVPVEKSPGKANLSNIPEFQLLKNNQKILEASKFVINSNYFPKIVAFAKIGCASPNPNNFFEVNFSTFYNVGIRLKLELFDWNKNFRSKEVISQNYKILDEELLNLERNFKIQINEEENNIQRYSKLAESDLAILDIQNDILKTSYSQLLNGTLTMSEYLIHYNNCERTKLSYEINKLQKLNAQYNYLVKSNQLDY